MKLPGDADQIFRIVDSDILLITATQIFCRGRDSAGQFDDGAEIVPYLQDRPQGAKNLITAGDCSRFYGVFAGIVKGDGFEQGLISLLAWVSHFAKNCGIDNGRVGSTALDIPANLRHPEAGDLIGDQAKQEDQKRGDNQKQCAIDDMPAAADNLLYLVNKPEAK